MRSTIKLQLSMYLYFLFLAFYMILFFFSYARVVEILLGFLVSEVITVYTAVLATVSGITVLLSRY